MTGRPRRVAAVAAASAAVVAAGCGGSHHGASSLPVPGSIGRAFPAVPAPPARGLSLPASRHGPTTCTIYPPGYATQIIVASPSLDVHAECAVWSANRPGYGYLWGYEQPVRNPSGIELCSMRDPDHDLVATVIEETGFSAITAAERATGLSACSRISASGWRRVGRGTRTNWRQLLRSLTRPAGLPTARSGTRPA